MASHGTLNLWKTINSNWIRFCGGSDLSRNLFIDILFAEKTRPTQRFSSTVDDWEWFIRKISILAQDNLSSTAALFIRLMLMHSYTSNCSSYQECVRLQKSSLHEECFKFFFIYISSNTSEANFIKLVIFLLLTELIQCFGVPTSAATKRDTKTLYANCSVCKIFLICNLRRSCRGVP